MTDNVVSMPERKRRLWLCDCGCSTFELWADGPATCAACNRAVTDEGAGFVDLPDRPSDIPAEESTRDVQYNGSMAFARRRVANMADDEDAAVIVVAKANGAVSTWAAAETDEQVGWSLSRLELAKMLIETNKRNKDNG